MLSWITSFPSYLWALFSLAVPLIIHLFSKSKGKPVAVGTLKFFQQLKPVKMTQVKLVERILLVLRLLMLICAVLLTAQLWWLNENNSENNDYYLITKGWLNESSIEEKHKLVAKLNENNAFILESTISSLNKEQILKWKKTNFSHRKPLWSALNIAHYTLPKNARFHIYTDSAAINFIGKPINISQSIQWYEASNNNDALPSKNIKPLQITVVADPDRAHSVLRIKQALTLIKSALIPALSLDIIENKQATNNNNFPDESTAAIIKNTDWLFYLSSDDNSLLLKSALNQGINVFIDAKELQKNLSQTLKNTIVSTENELLLEDALLHKQGTSISINALLTLAGLEHHYLSEALWLSENGFVILAKHEIFTENQTQIIYQLNSRLEPQWSDFTEQPQFVRVLLSLIQHEKTDLKQGLDPGFKLSLAQIQAFNTTENSLQQPETNKFLALLVYKEQPLTQWLILLLIVFWCFERLLSENSKSNQSSPINSESV